VVFISHNIESILRLCSRGILLNLGELVATDDVRKVMAIYHEAKEYNSKVVALESYVRPRQFLGRARLNRVELGSDDGRWSFPFGQPLAFDVWVESRISVTNIKLGIGLFSDRGIELQSERGAGDYIPEAVSFEVTVSPESADINAQAFGAFIIPSVRVSSVQH
jgi:lipopolysaccharide transport system ATP-binding protein